MKPVDTARSKMGFTAGAVYVSTESTLGLTESAAAIAWAYWPATREYRARIASIVFKTLKFVLRTRESKPARSAVDTLVKSLRPELSSARTVSRTVLLACGAGPGTEMSMGTP